MILALLLLKIISCEYSKSLRDRIVFDDKPEQVYDSLKQILPLLQQLPRNLSRGTPTFYEIYNDQIFVNDSNVDMSSVLLTSGFDENSIKRFKILVLYLERNYLSGSYKIASNTWHFKYRVETSATYVGVRYIVSRDSDSNGLTNKDVRIIDSTRNLYLIRYGP